MSRLTQDEFLQRTQRLCQHMATAELDCLLVFPGSNLRYITGLTFARESYRLLVAILCGTGELLLCGPTFEAQKLTTGLRPADVIIWTDEENQYQQVAAQIARRCGSRARVGLDRTANYYHVQALQSALQFPEGLVPQTVLETTRAIKSPAEIDCLRAAAQITLRRLSAVPEQLAAGMTERELVTHFGRGGMIQFGQTTATPNETAGHRQLKKDDIVVIDAGDWVEGYRSDITRTFFFGRPSEKKKEIYRIVDEARQAAIAAAMPGQPAQNVDAAARQVIERARLAAHFVHRGGHGIGLDFHEWPICVAGNQAPLAPGMVLTAEPGVYLRGEFGIRLEDDILITPTGHEIISQQRPQKQKKS